MSKEFYHAQILANMRILLLLLFLIFTIPIFGQVDTISIVTDSLISDFIEDTTEVEPLFTREIPDSLIVNDEDDFETAFEKYGQQIEWDSSDANAYFQRAVLLIGKDDLVRFGTVKCDEDIYQQAKMDFDKAVELRPYSRRYSFTRGEFHYNFLRYEEAREDFNDAYNKSWGHETKMEALAQRSVTNCRLGRTEPCLKDLETALRQDPHNIDLLKAKSFSHLILKEHALVIDYLNIILSLDSESRFAHSNMAYTAIGMGKYEKAISIYYENIKKFGEDALSIGNIGFAKMKLGRYEEALDDINRSLELFPNNSFAIKNRAMIYFHLEEKDKACKDLHRAKELGFTVEHGNELIELLFEKCVEVNRKPKK